MKQYNAKLREVTGQEPTIVFGDFNIKLINTSNDSYSSIGENHNSIVEYITYKGKYKTLLAADLELCDESGVASKVGKVDILKVAHHSYVSGSGYSSGSSISFIRSLNPKVAIITNNTVLPDFHPGSQRLTLLFPVPFPDCRLICSS